MVPLRLHLDTSDYAAMYSARSESAEGAVRANPEKFGEIAKDEWPLLFGRDFAERGDLRRYILGDVSRDDANKALRFFISDPENVYEIWFEKYCWDNPVPDRRDKMADKLGETLETLKNMLDGQTALKADIGKALALSGGSALLEADRDRLRKLKHDARVFRSEISSPEELGKHPAWIKLVGKEGALGIGVRVEIRMFHEPQTHSCRKELRQMAKESGLSCGLCGTGRGVHFGGRVDRGTDKRGHLPGGNRQAHAYIATRRLAPGRRIRQSFRQHPSKVRPRDGDAAENYLRVQGHTLKDSGDMKDSGDRTSVHPPAGKRLCVTVSAGPVT